MNYAYAPPSVNVHVTGRRIVATIVDGIVLGIIADVFRAIFGHPQTAHIGGLSYPRLSTGGSAAWLLVLLVYYVVLEGRYGRTVGKLVTGIKVISEADGQAPGLWRAFLRTVLRIIDGIASYLVGFIIVVNSSRRRRLGDMAGDTLVVRA